MDALAALSLQIAWGADEALDDTPVDRLRPPPPVQAPAARPRPVATPTQAAPAPAGNLITKAQAAAAACATIAELREALAAFTCPLAATATNLVFTDGNENAGLLIMGETPGEQEDRTGTPFTGPEGVLLHRMLASIGLDRTLTLLTNLIYWRPPGNRAPTDAEVNICLPFAQRLIALAQPRIIVTLGALATHALTNTDASIRRLRGKWRPLGTAQVLPMLHPNYLIQNPATKREAWLDLITLKRALNE
jgi:uracil-DNA glycosylase family 4